MPMKDYPLQVLRFPILVQKRQGGPWQKEMVRGASWEMAVDRLARALKPGETFDIEEAPFNPYVPAH